MSFTSIRYGFATNSSSTHSIVLHTSSRGRDKIDDNDTLNEFGWETFTLTSQKSKQNYIDMTAKPHNYDDPYAGYVDSSSRGLTTCPGGIDMELWHDFLMDDDVAIYGGNDNDDESGWSTLGIDGNAITPWTYDFIQINPDVLVGFDKSTGFKFRWSRSGEYLKSIVPELVDLKITDYCGYGCAFCYQGSTKHGKHASLADIKIIITNLKKAGTFEIALGGGEPYHHPHFKEIIQHCTDEDMTVNFTSYGTDWKTDKIIAGVSAIGVSVNSVKDCKKLTTVYDTEYYYFKKLVGQTVVGLLPLVEFVGLIQEMIKIDRPLLLLGYKYTGRGSDIEPYVYTDSEMKDVLLQIKAHIDGMDIYQKFSLSVDTAFIDRYGSVLDSLDISVILRSSPEGKFSCYIDATTGKIAPSSYCDIEEHIFCDMSAEDINEKFKNF